MENAKKGITVAGSLIADVFYEIDTYPNQGFLSTVRGTSLNIGGSGNIILDLAKLDDTLPVKVCAIVGDDDRGTDMLSILSEYHNINTADITIEGKSSVTMVMNAADTRQRTFFYIPEASDIFCESYIDWNHIDTKIFHLEYLLLMKLVDADDPQYGTHGARILNNAKARGMLTSIDVVSEQSTRAKNVVKAALKYTDICCINESEAELVTGISLLENGKLSRERVFEAVKEMQRMGVSKWIVIHAPECGYGYDCEKKEFVFVPSLKLPNNYIKGSNGAGDAYCSGILYGVHEGRTIEQSMQLARACAACSLSENNGTDGMRRYSEVLEVEKRYI